MNSSAQLSWYTYSEFPPSVRTLWAKGGPFKKAAEKVHTLLHQIDHNYPDPLARIPVSDHGERRINKCVKHKLNTSCRLVTWVNDGKVVLLFAGDHTATEKWLEKNRGFDLALDEDSGEITPIRRSPSNDPKNRISGPRAWHPEALYLLLDESLFDHLLAGLSPSIVMRLSQFDGTCEESELAELLEAVGDSDQKIALWDVFSLLLQGQKEEANNRARIFAGELKPLEEFPALDLPEIVDGPLIRKIPPDHPEFPKAFERFTKTANYKDWMLFMHPDQEKIAEAKFEGSAKLAGVSGSGKTCVIVRRAAELAKRYPDEKILVLTLNRPLAGLITELVDWYAPSEIAERIRTLAFFELCKELILRFEPDRENYLDDVTSATRDWHRTEHIDEIWRQFYRCELNWRKAEVLHPVHDSLLARQINPEEYLREEFDWIRSAMALQDQDTDYPDIPRKGRSQNLSKDFRQDVLTGLTNWREQMDAVGAIDHLGIAEWLSKHKEKITPEYRCILVDESQDFGTIELNLIRRLVNPGTDDIFLAGDAAQHVTWKHQSLKEAGINVPGARSQTMSKNYRNSREILKAAHFILTENLSEEMLENESFEILDPEFAQQTGNPPFLFSAPTVEEEISSALAYLEIQIDADTERKGCLAICGYSLFEIEDYGRRLGIPVLDRNTSLESNKLFLSDLEQTKGFEFDVVCIVNINEGVIPNPELPEQENFRDLARLYVAMTRAKTELVLSCSSDRSSFLSGVDEYCLDDEWQKHTGDVEQIGLPDRLDTIRQDNVEIPPISSMSGSQFLYQAQAIGLERPLISKIRQLINGKAKYDENKAQVSWKTIGECALTYSSQPGSRRAWGNEREALSALLSKLGIQPARNDSASGRQRMVVLANSRKQEGCCLAGKGLEKEQWIRPVSSSPTGEITHIDTLYEDGSQIQPLDIVEFYPGEVRAHPHQPENVLFEHFHWEKAGRVSFEELEHFQDHRLGFLEGEETLKNDRVPELHARGFSESLGLIYVINPKLVVEQKRYRQQLRILFKHEGISFNLAVTDRQAEREYLNRQGTEHLLPRAYICVSLGEPYYGYCYRLAACIITP